MVLILVTCCTGFFLLLGGGGGGSPSLQTKYGLSDTSTTLAVEAEDGSLVLPVNTAGLFNLTAAKLPEFQGQVR